MDPQSAGDPQSTYDRIAAHFSKTREYAWPEVESFLDGRTATRGLDIGCGNGRHTELLAERADAVVGVDLSRELLREAVARARERGTTGPRRSSTATPRPSRSRPMRSGSPCTSRPSTTSPSREARVRSLDELARVLAPGGTALVSAWSTAHDRFDREEGFDTTVDWTLPGGETVPRYYHIYSPAEFEIDLGESALSVVDVDISSGNCYATVTASDA